MLLMVLIAGNHGYRRLISSRQTFEHYRQALDRAESLNPVERLVFSLVLANTPAPEPER